VRKAREVLKETLETRVFLGLKVISLGPLNFFLGIPLFLWIKIIYSIAFNAIFPNLELKRKDWICCISFSKDLKI